MDDKMKRVFDTLDDLGWSVTEYDDGWEISQYSPAGEDFSFCILRSNVESAFDFVREAINYSCCFDVEDHVKMWLEAKDYGTSGVPDIMTLVDDARAINEMLDDLVNALLEVLK